MQAKEYAEALFQAVSETKPLEHDKIIDRLVEVMAANGDLAKMDEIEEQFKKLERESKGITEVEITTASDVKSKELLTTLNNIVGNHIEVKQKIDDGLIGGVVVRAGDTLIDASVKNSLNNLKNTISK